MKISQTNVMKNDLQPFEVGDLVSFKPHTGYTAGLEGVVIGAELKLNEDSSIDIDGLSSPPESILSAPEAFRRVVVHIPLQWPRNSQIANLKGIGKQFGHNAYLIIRAGMKSLELDSVAEIEKRDIGGHIFWDAWCDHDRNIHAKGASPEMARLKLAHELVKQPEIK